MPLNLLLLCSSTESQRSPPFSSKVIAQALGHGNVKYLAERSIVGRLTFWDHLSDQGSLILCPPDSDLDDAVVR